MNITPQQLSKIREAMHLAGFFAENPSREQTAKDQATVKAAWAALYAVERGHELKTYDVTIRATVTKTIRVEADSQESAYCEAHEQFSTECDGQEYYEEETLHVDEVTQ